MNDTSDCGAPALNAAGVEVGQVQLARDELDSVVAATRPLVSALRGKLVRTRVAKKVRMRAADSDAAIIAAWASVLMRTDPKRHPDVASCAYATDLITKMLARDATACEAWEEGCRAKNRAKEASARPESRQTGALNAFARTSPKSNPELSEAMRALA